MSQQSLILSQEQKESRLTERELNAYHEYARQNRPPMAASTQAQFFQLFLNGSTCEEIVRLNPNGFTLGAIVRARIDNNWDQKLDEHRELLMVKVREKVQQIQLETIDRIANEIAASNKLVNDKVLKFLQTGDTAELAGTSVGSIRHLKEVIEMLMKLTGQGNKSTVAGTVEHRVSVQATTATSELPILPAGKPLTPADAANVLTAIHRNRGGAK